MAVAVSGKGIEMLAEKINEIYGQHIVAAKATKMGILVLVNEDTNKFDRPADAVRYLEGLKRGIEAVKNGI